MIVPKFPLVSSDQNPVFRDLLESLDGQGQRVLVHGLKAACDLVGVNSSGSASRLGLSQGQGLVPKTIVARESFRIDTSKLATELFQTRFKDPVSRLVFSDALFDQIDPFGVPDVIVAFEKPLDKKWSVEFETQSPAPTLVLATQNPLNFGACLRSAAAFGVNRIVALKECASPWSSKVIRASMGHVFHVDIFSGPSLKSLISELSKLGDRVVALDMNGVSLKSFQWPTNPIFLLGEEGQGLPASSRIGHQVKIPMSSSVESLNVSVSASIAMYDWSSKTPS